MGHCVRILIFRVPYPLPVLSTGYKSETSHAPSTARIAHRQQHGRSSVAHHVAGDVACAVAGKSFPECSLWAAGARRVRIPARAAALLLRKDATSLRALDLTPASLLRTAHVSFPVPRSHRAPAGRGHKQNPEGGDLRTGLRALGQESFPKMPACAPAPDWRPIPSLRSVIPQAASRARFALDSAPHQSRLGTLLPLSLTGARSCFCRDRLSQRWGASFTLRRLGAAYHGSPALGGRRKLLALGSESFLPGSPVAGTTCVPRSIGESRQLFVRKAIGYGRSPNQTSGIEQLGSTAIQSIVQCTTKPE